MDRPGYSLEAVWVETYPGVFLGANLYLPSQRKGRIPAVLIPHGHWKHGRAEDIEEYSVPRLAANLAIQGYAAVTYDMLGYNDTRALPHSFGDSATETLWAFHPLGWQLWNSIRVLDFAVSLNEVDSRRIGVTGASGGGTQSYLLAAVDPRIAASIPVNMVSATFQGDCVCEGAPGLRIDTNNIEIAAMTAPRPQLLISATGDWTKETPRLVYPAVRSVYELYGKPEAVESVQIDGPHNYNRASREAAYAFFDRHLMHGKTDHPKEFEPKEVEIEPLSAKELLLLPHTPPPGVVGDRDQLFARWKEEAEGRTQKLTQTELRHRWQAMLAARWPSGPIKSDQMDNQILISRLGVGDSIPALWYPGIHNRAVLVVHPDGAEAALETDEVKTLRATGASVLLIDVFQTGRAKEERDRGGRHFLTYNRTDDACRAQDILTALAYLHAQRPDRLELLGIGKAAVWAYMARPLVPVPVILRSEPLDWAGRDEDFQRDFFVPGIQFAGGLAAARQLNMLPS